MQETFKGAMPRFLCFWLPSFLVKADVDTFEVILKILQKKQLLWQLMEPPHKQKKNIQQSF